MTLLSVYTPYTRVSWYTQYQMTSNQPLVFQVLLIYWPNLPPFKKIRYSCRWWGKKLGNFSCAINSNLRSHGWKRAYCNMTETQKNKRAWVSYIFPANFIFCLETCCDTFHEHFRSSKYRITHPNYSSTTYIDYTLYTVKLQRQLPFQITFALYDLNDALSYSRM